MRLCFEEALVYAAVVEGKAKTKINSGGKSRVFESHISHRQHVYTVVFCRVRKLTILNVHESVHRKNIPIYIQQDATLQSLLYLETILQVSDGTSTHHQEGKQLYLQHLIFVTRCNKYQKCRVVSRYNKLCNVASCWIYLDICLAVRHSITFLLLPTWYTNFLFIHTNYIKLNSSTCFERDPPIIRKSTTQIVHMQPLVSSLSASDRLVQPLRKDFL